MPTYWPWWIIAPALAALTVGHWILLRRPLGVSGVLARFSRVREELAFDRGTAVMQSDAAALEAAMAAAAAEFLKGPLPEVLDRDLPPAPAQPVHAPADARQCAPTPPMTAHFTFLAAVAAGGFLAALSRGTFGAGSGDAFARLIGSGPLALAALGGGGVLVGFGTALCGGCSSGHGLTGCGRLMPGSLVATAAFFAAAVGVSLLLGGFAS